MIRCAVIGGGYVAGEAHMPALRALPQVEVAALCESSPESGLSFQQKHHIPRLYGSLDELLAAAQDIDFVTIATPPHTHYDLARAALEAGLHVLVEKPLALSARLGGELDALARQRGRKLCVLQNYRYRDAVLRAREALGAGRLGALHQVAITSHGDEAIGKRAGWQWQEMGSRVLLYELGIHFVDLEIDFAGPVKDIVGFHSARDPRGHVTQVHALVEHQNGVIGTIDLQIQSSANFVRFELFGSEQDVLIKLFPEAYLLHRGWISPVVELKSEARRFWNVATASLWEKLTRPAVRRRVASHYRVIAGFVQSLLHPGLQPPVTAGAVLPTLELLDAMHARLGPIS